MGDIADLVAARGDRLAARLVDDDVWPVTALEFPIGGIDDGIVRLRPHADSDLKQ